MELQLIHIPPESIVGPLYCSLKWGSDGWEYKSEISQPFENLLDMDIFPIPLSHCCFRFDLTCGLPEHNRRTKEDWLRGICKLGTGDFGYWWWLLWRAFSELREMRTDNAGTSLVTWFELPIISGLIQTKLAMYNDKLAMILNRGNLPFSTR